jgi:hypothetical protein
MSVVFRCVAAALVGGILSLSAGLSVAKAHDGTASANPNVESAARVSEATDSVQPSAVYYVYFRAAGSRGWGTLGPYAAEQDARRVAVDYLARGFQVRIDYTDGPPNPPTPSPGEVSN